MIGPRSSVEQVAIRMATPLAVVTATFLFFAGHNRPGGGLAAGLLVGAIVALRTMAGLQRPLDPARLLAIGALTTVGVSMAPMAFGRSVLDQTVGKLDVPLLGTVKFGSALVYDAGVLLIVVGLIVAVLDGLGIDAVGADPDRSSR